MANLSSSPESSSPEKTAQVERHHSKTHHKQTSGGGGSKSHGEGVAKEGEGVADSHTEPKATHHTTLHRSHGSRRSGTQERTHERERVPKATEGTADNSHTEAKTTTHHTTHNKTNASRRSGTYERTHERGRDGKGSEEPGKRFSVTKLLATPFFLLGGALSAAGGVVFGVGSMVKGFGRGKE